MIKPVSGVQLHVKWLCQVWLGDDIGHWCASHRREVKDISIHSQVSLDGSAHYAVWQLTLQEIIPDVGAVDVARNVERGGKQRKETGDKYQW